MELWIGTLVAASIVFLGLWLLTLRERRERTLARALGQMGAEDAYEGAAQPRVFGRWLEQTATRLAGPEGLGQAAQQLRWAGLDMRPEEFYATKLAAALLTGGFVLSMGVIGLGPVGISLSTVACALAFAAPNVWVRSRIQVRKREVDGQLLGCIDMLVVSCEAGLNLGDALGHVADRMGGLLGREIRRAGEEMRLGAPRAQALLAVADRVGHDGLTRALQEVTQAEKTGTPVVRILRQQGQVLRDERRLRAQELAQKSSLKLMAPVILLIFLPTMVLILSPAVINILNVLR